MELADLEKNVHYTFSIIPLAYWITVIVDGYFESDLKFVFLGAGIFITAWQIFTRRIFYENFGERFVFTHPNGWDEIDIIKNEFLTWEINALYTIYAATTFYFMITGTKNEIIWGLLCLESIGILYYIFSIGRLAKIVLNKSKRKLLLYRR